MKKQNLLLLAFGLSVFVWVIHYIALIFYLYWTTVWYDIIVHVTGGLTIAVLVVLFLNIQHRSPKSLLTVLILTLIVGIGWEVWEYIIDETFAIEGYVLDSGVDLIMDTLGAIAAYFITIARSPKSF